MNKLDRKIHTLNNKYNQQTGSVGIILTLVLGCLAMESNVGLIVACAYIPLLMYFIDYSNKVNIKACRTVMLYTLRLNAKEVITISPTVYVDVTDDLHHTCLTLNISSFTHRFSVLLL